MFTKITIRDFSKPIKERHHGCTGPYYWLPSQPGKGRGFYQAVRGLECDKSGSTFNLRLEWANDHCRHDTIGYYCDAINEGGDPDNMGGTLQPIIARLPSGRGFLPGWTMGAGMCAAIDTTWILDNVEDAALAAHEVARIDADQALESSADWHREVREEEEAEDFIKDCEAARPDMYA